MIMQKVPFHKGEVFVLCVIAVFLMGVLFKINA